MQAGWGRRRRRPTKRAIPLLRRSGLTSDQLLMPVLRFSRFTVQTGVRADAEGGSRRHGGREPYRMRCPLLSTQSQWDSPGGESTGCVSLSEGLADSLPCFRRSRLVAASGSPTSFLEFSCSPMLHHRWRALRTRLLRLTPLLYAEPFRIWPSLWQPFLRSLCTYASPAARSQSRSLILRGCWMHSLPQFDPRDS